MSERNRRVYNNLQLREMLKRMQAKFQDHIDEVMAEYERERARKPSMPSFEKAMRQAGMHPINRAGYPAPCDDPDCKTCYAKEAVARVNARCIPVPIKEPKPRTKRSVIDEEWTFLQRVHDHRESD